MDKKELPCYYISLPTASDLRVGPRQVGKTSTKNLGFCIFFESVVKTCLLRGIFQKNEMKSLILAQNER
jgi:hypothetical protein